MGQMDSVDRISEILKPYISEEPERMKVICQILGIIIRDQEDAAHV